MKKIIKKTEQDIKQTQLNRKQTTQKNTITELNKTEQTNKTKQ